MFEKTVEFTTPKLHNYIKIFDNFIPTSALDVLTKVCKNHDEFNDGKIVNNSPQGTVDKETRNVKIWEMENLNTNNYTQIFWSSYLVYTFKKALQKYDQCFKLNSMYDIIDVQILKYTEGGHYNFHVDSGIHTPRTLSCIFFINDDYEGGNLLFRFPNQKEIINVEKVKNRMIVWPSNFLYPHSVSPVTKGERYSVVSWSR